MAVRNRNLFRALLRPTKNNAPLVIDANGVKAFQVAFEGFLSVRRRDRQIGERRRPVHVGEFSKCNASDISKPLASFAREKLLGFFV